MWIICHDAKKDQDPYSFVFAHLQDNVLCWAEKTIQGYIKRDVPLDSIKGHKKLFKDNQLNKEYCLRQLEKHFGNQKLIVPLENKPDLTKELIAMDSQSKKNLGHLDIGVLYHGADSPVNIKKLCGQKDVSVSDSFQKFLSLLIPKEDHTEGTLQTKWNQFSVQWFIGPHLDKDEIRRKIGNAMVLFVFHDSPEPFEPHDLFLGQVTNFVCVIQPHKVGDELMWRLGFYLHYETKQPSKEQSEVLRVQKEQEAFGETLAQFNPVIPINYLFDSQSLQNFLLTKSFNARLHATQHHAVVRKQFEAPIRLAMEEFQKKHDVVKAYRTEQTENLYKDFL